ncbi:nuclear transport factor 2 family protein [Roseateles sp. MS654]|uniref:nuclear transport factor 2 family protein n=1 Tax=Roseateles sp. MS654 TaxID=3412685 RepID=UPI003C2D7F36
MNQHAFDSTAPDATYVAAVERYLERLEASDVEGLTALFAGDAQVVSPFLGRMNPRPFFEKVRDASGQSRIEVLDILLSARGAPLAIAYFVYHWQLKDGTAVRFDCVDVFEFNSLGLIQRMTIVYDTHPVRELVGNKYG